MKKEYFLLGGGLLAILFGCLSFAVYKAYVQAEVYHREGISISTWEVFIGAKPAERSIHMREDTK